MLNDVDSTQNEKMAAVSTAKWLSLNLKVDALSVGTSGRPLLYQVRVEEIENWMTHNRFQESFTVAQTLPGPQLVNLAGFLGFRIPH